MKVISSDKKTCRVFIESKHYTKRMPIFWKGFALMENGIIAGVIVYGQPSPPLQRHAFKDRDFRFYELSRLVVQTDTPNAASYLIANSLKMLESPCAVVSYADSEQGHCGIVYQATNWIYTGATVSHDYIYIVEGKRVMPISLRDKYGITNPVEWAKSNGIEKVKPLPKHRYFYFVGDKRQKKQMKSKLNYPEVNCYPKCKKSKYDDGEKIIMEVLL